MTENSSSRNFKLTEDELNKPLEATFDVVCKLGEGSYGSVYKAQHKATGEIFAIKQVPVDSDLRDIVKEISIMQQCESEFVVKYYGSYYQNMDLWIIMEFCYAGSVLDIMRTLRHTLSEEAIGRIMQDTLRGLEYLHLRRKIHRDVKAGNILLSADGTAKLADFGVSGQLTDTLAKRNTVIGTPYWMAPEVIQEVGYDSKADIWSLGITCIEMAEGKPPFSDVHPMRAIFMIPTRSEPTFHDSSKWSSDFINFISCCLKKDPRDRLNSSLLLKHEFIRKNKTSPTVLQLVNRIKQRSVARRSLKSCGHQSSTIKGSSYLDMFPDESSSGSEESTCKSNFIRDRDNFNFNDNTIYRTAVEDIRPMFNKFSDCDSDKATKSGSEGTLLVKYEDETIIGTAEGGTFVVSPEGSQEEGTIVQRGTMSTGDGSSGASSTYIPAYLRHKQIMSSVGNGEKEGDDIKGKKNKDTLDGEILMNIPVGPSGQVDSSALQKLPLSELVKRLEQAEKDQESDINKIRKHYLEKRQPILDALAHKSGNAP